jgi:sterol desaturase/sphingolipid hydroxylase (fatty acid hydroxylase superfamily)
LSVLRTLYYASMVGGFALLVTWEAGSPLIAHPARRWRHIGRNLILFLLVLLIADGLVGERWLAISGLLRAQPAGLLTNLGLPLVALGCIAFVVADLAEYALHRVTHRLRWLWLLHTVHHADPHVDVSTGSRHHPIEVAIGLTFKIGLYVLLGIPLWLEGVRTIMVNPLMMIQHANIDYPPWVERRLGWLLVTPAMHRVHHSPDAPETNANYGQVLALWDRLFGTYRTPGAPPQPVYGLRALRDDGWQSVTGMLLTPVRARGVRDW